MPPAWFASAGRAPAFCSPCAHFQAVHGVRCACVRMPDLSLADQTQTESLRLIEAEAALVSRLDLIAEALSKSRITKNQETLMEGIRV